MNPARNKMESQSCFLWPLTKMTVVNEGVIFCFLTFPFNSPLHKSRAWIGFLGMCLKYSPAPEHTLSQMRMCLVFSGSSAPGKVPTPVTNCSGCYLQTSDRAESHAGLWQGWTRKPLPEPSWLLALFLSQTKIAPCRWRSNPVPLKKTDNEGFQFRPSKAIFPHFFVSHFQSVFSQKRLSDRIHFANFPTRLHTAEYSSHSLRDTSLCEVHKAVFSIHNMMGKGERNMQKAMRTISSVSWFIWM